MVLKPQDILVLLKLISRRGQAWTYLELASELGMSASEISAGIRRSTQAGLLLPTSKREDKPQPVRQALLEFLIHGLRYAFPPKLGQLTRGLPTAWAAPPLCNLLTQPDEPPPVWPDAEGEVRGIGFSPLYPSVPTAARCDKDLYEMLALLDAIRGGRARERKIAARELRRRIERKGS